MQGIPGIRYTKAAQLKYTRLQGGGGGGGGGGTSLLSSQIGAHSRELQMKILSHSCSPGLGAVVTNDWCIMHYPSYFKTLKCCIYQANKCQNTHLRSRINFMLSSAEQEEVL